jgi:hypothetical protein
LADLQFRGAVWLQRNGREWTARSLLGSASGIDVEIAKDNATKDALVREVGGVDHPVLARCDGGHRPGEREIVLSAAHAGW